MKRETEKIEYWRKEAEKAQKIILRLENDLFCLNKLYDKALERQVQLESFLEQSQTYNEFVRRQIVKLYERR